MTQALFEKRVLEMVHCLRKCFRTFKIFRASTTEDFKEELFWLSVNALDRRSNRESINLTTTVCPYFYGFVSTYWRKYRSGSRKNNVISLDDNLMQLDLKSDERDVLTNLLEKEKVAAMHKCIVLLDERGQQILKAYFSEKKDVDIYQDFGFTNPRSLSQVRRRYFLQLEKHFRNHHPELFKI